MSHQTENINKEIENTTKKQTENLELKSTITEMKKSWNNINCLIKATKGRKRVEDKNRTKEPEQQIQHMKRVTNMADII